MVGIEKLLLLISAIQTLGTSGKLIAADGLGVDDLPKALELIKHYEEFIAVAKSFDEAIVEAKDIDSAEAVQLVIKLIAAVKAIKEA